MAFVAFLIGQALSIFPLSHFIINRSRWKDNIYRKKILVICFRIACIHPLEFPAGVINFCPGISWRSGTCKNLDDLGMDNAWRGRAACHTTWVAACVGAACVGGQTTYGYTHRRSAQRLSRTLSSLAYGNRMPGSVYVSFACSYISIQESTWTWGPRWTLMWPSGR